MRYLLALAAVAWLASCGGSDPPPRAAPTLVSFQRNGGLAATLDAVLVRADGWTRADKRYGGAGRRYDDFQLRPAALRRLRTELAALPARPPRAAAGARGGSTYLLRYRGTTYYAREGAVPRTLRRVVRTLDDIADGGGRSGRVHHVTQAPA